MRGVCFVLPVFVAAFLFLTAPAEVFAQIEVDPHDPTVVYADDEETTYGALVTTNYSFLFRLKIYRNDILKYDKSDLVYCSGPSVYYDKTVDVSEWGLGQGDDLDFLGRATIRSGPYRGSYDEENWQIIVSGYTMKLESDELRFAPDAPCAIREEFV